MSRALLELLLRITHYASLITHHSLLITHYPLLITHYYLNLHPPAADYPESDWCCWQLRW